MLESALRRTAEKFWELANHQGSKFPRDIESAVAWSLPLFIVRVPQLYVHDVEIYLRKRQLPAMVGTADRALHGCVIATCGKGFIVVDGADPPNELRFTIAHEVAHFLLDYQQPRQLAIEKLGPQIQEVLDGHRRPTPQQRLDGVLANAPVGLYAHFMHREDGHLASSKVFEAEGQADRLALELLAPETEVWFATQKNLKSASFTGRIAALQRLLTRRFGLPSYVAQKYSANLCSSRFGGPSVREWLGMS